MDQPIDMNARVEVETLGNCPYCQSPEFKLWCRATDRQFGGSQEFAYSWCGACGLLFQSERPLETAVAVFYPEHYLPYQDRGSTKSKAKGLRQRLVGKGAGALNLVVRKLFPDPVPAALKTTYQPPHPGARLLDFGCGSPRFLDGARRSGWETSGIDFSPQAVESVRQSGHQAWLMNDEVWTHLEDGSLDLVRLSHVLEHLYEPQKVLRQLKGKMKAGSILHLAVPNPTGVSARLFRGNWYGLEVPRHIMLFSPALLQSMLKELGFVEIQVLQETVTRDFVRSLGYAFRNERWGPGSDEQPLFYPLARVMTKMKRGDRFHVICRIAA